MRSIAVSIVFTAALAAPICGSLVMAETFMEKTQRDELSWVPRNDPDMAAAMRKARATLPEFLALSRAPRPSTTGFSVKVAVHDGSNTEYFWITPFKEQDGRFNGSINNTPRVVKTVKFGQSFDFSEGEIVDWLYVDGGRMKGNYTVCVILKREPKEQAEAAKKRFGLECDL
jgi:uncharacterized protein YegJ (DUF2314 family)